MSRLLSFRGQFCLSEKNLFNGCTYQKMLVYKVVTFLKRIKKGRFIFYFFGSDPSKMDQTWSNLIKLDFLANLKMLLWKVVTFPERIKMAALFLIFFGSDPSKMDQTWSNWISDEIIIEIYHQIFYVFFWSDWVRSV